jgi:lipopolysaccharide/colanic/teichoic acid biosynthesis glycosyltransferase
VALVPVLVASLVVAVAVGVTLGRPILFVQVRSGLGGHPFRMLKFRTMARGDGASDEARMTPFGGWLRSWSLDELPGLWNVLTGDMSLVGPRPLLPEYGPLYSAEQARRLSVPPGVTGWAQVNGRNGVSWADRFRLDVWYVEHASLALDLKILAATVGLVLRRHGISQPGRATMERFRGND